MKKSIILVLLTVLMFTLVACGENTNQAANGGNSVQGGSDSMGETTAPSNGENTQTETSGQRVTFGKLDNGDVERIWLATDQCFVYREDSRFRGYGVADYDGNILAEADYSNYEMVGDKIILWNTRKLVVYNTDGELLEKISVDAENGEFDSNMDASDQYYYLDYMVQEQEYEHMDVYGTTLYNLSGSEVCSFIGTLRTYPNEDGFFLASTNRDTTNAVIDMSGTELKLTAADGRKIDSFSIHQQGDVYGGAFLFGTQYGRFDSILFENGEEQNDVSGIIDASTKTVRILDENVRLYDCNSDYVIAVVTNENGDEVYGLYEEGFGKMVINLSEHPALAGHGLHDAKFFSREKGYILLSLKGDYHAIIDTNGEVIVSATEGFVPFRTNSDYLSDNGCYFFETDDGMGVTNLSGDAVIPCGQYKDITPFIHGYAVVEGTSIINDQGNVVYSISE